jgi:S-adenosylmethionine hydrolase
VDDIGTDSTDWIPGLIEDPHVGNARVSGIVITVDAFGNLISNIDASLIESFDNPMVNVAGKTIAMTMTYGRVSPGEFLAIINSFGVVEIARSEDSATNGLGCERGAPVVIIDAK